MVVGRAGQQILRNPQILAPDSVGLGWGISTDCYNPSGNGVERLSSHSAVRVPAVGWISLGAGGRALLA